MATSSKVKFNLEVLTSLAVEAIEAKVERAQKDLDALDDPAKIDTLLAEWRARQKERLEDLIQQLDAGTITDRDFMLWKVQPSPNVSLPSDRLRATTTLRAFQAQRDQVRAKAKSLVADEDGSIALTKTQLEEFFGL